MCTTRCVTKATPFQFIDGNILKSCRTGLTNHTQSISHHVTLLVINSLGSWHTDTHTHIPMCSIAKISMVCFFTKTSFTGLSGIQGAQVVCKWLQLAWPGKQPAGNHSGLAGETGINVAAFCGMWS